MMIVLMIMNPAYMKVLFQDPKGSVILTVAGVMQVIGSAIIWKIIHIEV
jgi:Flp pilus assembly protein TadB